MTRAMLFAKLILIASLPEFKLQSISADNQCSLEELSVIKQENLELLNQEISTLRSQSEQNRANAKRRINEVLESSPALTSLNELEILIKNIQPSECAKQLQQKLELEKLNIDLLLSKCRIKSNKNEISLDSKIESILIKQESIKLKAESSLQKCSAKYSAQGCPIVKSCNQAAVFDLKSKIQMSSIKINSAIEKAISEQNACLAEATAKASSTKGEIEQEILVCQESNLQEPTKPTESSTNSCDSKYCNPDITTSQEETKDVKTTPQIVTKGNSETQTDTAVQETDINNDSTENYSEVEEHQETSTVNDETATINQNTHNIESTEDPEVREIDAKSQI